MAYSPTIETAEPLSAAISLEEDTTKKIRKLLNKTAKDWNT